MKPAGSLVAAPARHDARTKRLARRLRPGEIAIVEHADLDGPAAEELLAARVRAVVNLQPFVTGRFPARGATVLAARGVPLFEVEEGAERLRAWPDGAVLRIELPACVARGRDRQVAARLRAVDPAELRARLERAAGALGPVLEAFLQNTVEHARREAGLLRAAPPLPRLRTALRGRPALVVARGPGARADLLCLRPFLRQRRPALLAVDGGADLLLALGLRPDLIVGDMDSASERALRCGAELVVHAYPDGRAPGLERLRRLGLAAHLLPVPGTSEDAALLLAHEAGADPIVAVGTHVDPIDFLEKGRPGMASTWLVRLRVGPRLVDARGVHRLVGPAPVERYLGPLVAAAATAAGAVAAVSPPVHGLLRLLWLELRLALGM